MSETTVPALDLVELTGSLVCAYVSNNHVRASELPTLITSVHGALTAMIEPVVDEAPAEPAYEQPTPAQIRKSITHDHLVSFIDGRPYKTLKRHLGSHGLTEHSYRQRYGLPADYPMVAASYAAQRSELAKAIGLGRLGGQAAR